MDYGRNRTENKKRKQNFVLNPKERHHLRNLAAHGIIMYLTITSGLLNDAVTSSDHIASTDDK
jgi:hypothetical protein